MKSYRKSKTKSVDSVDNTWIIRSVIHSNNYKSVFSGQWITTL